MTAQMEATRTALVENAEFALTARDLAVITRIMQQEAGISLTGAKANCVLPAGQAGAQAGVAQFCRILRFGGK